MKQKIVIRADGGTTIGMGHVIRCLALAHMLKNEFSIVFAIQQPVESIIKNIHTITETILHLPTTENYTEDASNFCQFLESSDIVVIDGYNFDTNYQQAIKEKGCKLVAIDDLHAWHQLADVVINHAEGLSQSLYSAETTTQFCLGLDYVLLRNEFLTEKKTAKKITSLSNFFISMGAADIDNNTKKIIEALLQIDAIKEINAMVSTINIHIKDIEKLALINTKVKLHINLSAIEIATLTKKCDVTICPASTISLESCAIGTGLISGYTANNQKGILNGLIKHKTLINFGNINDLSIKDIKNKIEKLTIYPSVFNELIENQKNMIDNKSPERLLTIFKALN